MRIGSLFSGIGGLELGLERAGVGHTTWQVEIDEYCQAVLAKHWPRGRRYLDVRAVHARTRCPFRTTSPSCPNCLENVDVICGGFPCQDVSDAGTRAGLTGARSGLWSEYARIVGELRPTYVVVENVAALLDRGFGDVLGTLATLGYDAQWSVLPACAVGHPHARDRLFVIAYAHRLNGPAGLGIYSQHDWKGPVFGASDSQRAQALQYVEAVADRVRGDDGLPNRVDRVTALGNAVVPQVAEVIGRVLLQIKAEVES